MQSTSLISSAPFLGPSLLSFSTKFNFWKTDAMLEYKIFLFLFSSEKIQIIFSSRVSPSQ